MSYKLLGRMYIEKGDFESALNTFKEAIEYSPDNLDFYLALGLLHLHKKDNTTAMECLSKVLNIDVKNIDVSTQCFVIFRI
jgi:tetratricopeptide (TPR) repeat protein